MYRYTAQLKLTQGESNEQEIKSVVSQAFLKQVSPFRLGAVIQQADGLYVQIISELKLEKVENIFQDIVKQLDMELNRVGWGWLFPDLPNTSVAPVSLSHTDPYDSIPSQEEGSRDYRVLTLLSSLRILIFVLVVLFITGAFELQKASWLCIVTYSLPFALIIVVLILQVSRIQCNDPGIEIKFLIRPQKIFSWEQVSGLRTFTMRSSSYCLIETVEGVSRFPVIFLASFGDSPVLIKTIIEQVSLNFVKAQPAAFAGRDDALYRRFDAQPKSVGIIFRLLGANY